jgi:hypothetical protein
MKRRDWRISSRSTHLKRSLLEPTINKVRTISIESRLLVLRQTKRPGWKEGEGN